jgi:hypothetical protein
VEAQWRSAKRDGFYHSLSLPEEIAALAAVRLRCRFQVRRAVKMDDAPMVSFGQESLIDPSLVSGDRNLGRLETWLENVSRLPEHLHQRFILAVRLYNEAVRIIEESPDLSYLSLVSAIETLAFDYEIERPSLSEYRKDLASLLEGVGDDKLRGQLAEAFMKDQHFIKRRFKKFVLDYTPRLFWESQSRPALGRVAEEDLGRLLGLIYDQRSGTLHEGRSFPPNVFHPPIRGAEIDWSESTTYGGRVWQRKEYIPNPHFFEGLVRSVLLAYVERHRDSQQRTEIGQPAEQTA